MSVASRVPPALAAIVVAALGLAAWPYTVDDAFVLGRYARRVATGLGHTMTAGPPTDGVTGPLGLLPGIMGVWCGGDPVALSKIVGLLAGVAAAALVVRLAANRSGGRVAAWWTLAAVSLSPTLVVWSVAGLETGIASLAATFAGIAAIRRPRPDGFVLGASLGALAWLRPEMFAFAVALLAATAAADRAQGARAAFVAGLATLGVLAYRWALFEELLPLAVHAKPGEITQGVAYALRALLVTGGAFGALLLLAPRARRDARVLTLALGAHLVAVVVAGGDWMPGFRLFAPVWPVYALAFGLSTSRLQRSQRGVARAAAILCACVALAVPAATLLLELPRVREAGATRRELGVPLAHRIARAGHVVALVDVGLLVYETDARIVDLGGITDPLVARLEGGHLDKHVGADLLEQRGVDVIVLHASERPAVDGEGRIERLAGWPVERRVAALPWVRAHFVVDEVTQYADHYWYVVLTRR